jgi:hypothetical protein
MSHYDSCDFSSSDEGLLCFHIFRDFENSWLRRRLQIRITTGVATLSLIFRQLFADMSFDDMPILLQLLTPFSQSFFARAFAAAFSAAADATSLMIS